MVFGPKTFPKDVIYHSTLKPGSLGQLDSFDFQKFWFFIFRSLFLTKMPISQENVNFFPRKTKSGRGLKFATDVPYNIILKFWDPFGNCSNGFWVMECLVFRLAKNSLKPWFLAKQKTKKSITQKLLEQLPNGSQNFKMIL